MDTPVSADAAFGGAAFEGAASGAAAGDASLRDTVLGGRYRLGRLLGAGGMAEVYEGWDERLQRAVAVKLLRPELAAHAGLRQRFELEARAAARLTHPNVVAVFDAGDDRGRSYIVMERLRGESLADAIARGPVDLTWLRRLAGETLSALGAAHDAGIIHRDIKPANILLGPDGRAKVADFGIARVAETRVANEAAAALTGTGLVLGTPAYLAPERAMGDPATPQSDLYSLGVVLYEALTGRKPYGGTTPVAIAAAAVNGAAENPYLLRPDADPQLVAVIGRAMARDPAQRYATAALMAADLFGQGPAQTTVMPARVASTAVPFTAERPRARRSGAPRARPSGAPPRRARLGGRWSIWAFAGLSAVAVALVAVYLLGAGQGTGTPAVVSSTTAATASTSTTVAPTTSLPPTTTATTAPTLAGPSDPISVALSNWAGHLARSKSAAADQLAAGLVSVAALGDSPARARAASDLLDQAVQWYQAGKLTTSEYVTAAALLHQAGAPPPPPPTALHHNPGGAGGGGG